MFVTARCCIFFFQAEDGIRDLTVTGVQTCALPIYLSPSLHSSFSAGLQFYHTRGDTVFADGYFFPVPGLSAISATTGPRSNANGTRSEERRVGKEGRSRWSPYH